MVTDYTLINPYIERPVHPFPSPDIVFQSVGKDSKWFVKLDALHNYYQLPLGPESKKLTAFLLPQGRIYYRVGPMGLNPSGDWWYHKSDEAIAGLSGVLKLVDNILVHAPLLVELRARSATTVSCSRHRPQQEEVQDRPQRSFHRPKCDGRGH